MIHEIDVDVRQDGSGAGRNHAPLPKGVTILQIDTPELRAAIKCLVAVLDIPSEIPMQKRIRRLAHALSPIMLEGGDVTQAFEAALFRRRYLKAVTTFSCADLGILRGIATSSASRSVSRWQRSGRIFAVPFRRSVRVPAFQISDGEPRQLIARVLSALPTDMRAGWQAAEWFATPSAKLGCAPQDAVLDPATADDVIDLAAEAVTPVA